jgi:hypothetical protein
MKTKVIQKGVLLDGTGKPPIKDSVVIIEGNKITKIGEKGSGDFAEWGGCRIYRRWGEDRNAGDDRQSCAYLY